jgi:uracil-DNA glycosylase
MSVVKLHPSWLKVLESEFQKPYMQALKAFLQNEKEQGKQIYPPGNSLFTALNATPLEDVKVVILGQDPYHGPHQANGLCFSVNDGIPFPPSLQNIFKELGNDLQLPFPRTGNLLPWAKQGVLLLNATLTVRHSEAGSHQNKGWEVFTDHILSVISEKAPFVVFLLWGKYAQDKSVLINTQKHCILTAPHPSPLSAYRGFLGCKHFSICNKLLQEKGMQEIDWKL